ncbi:MAG: hypothetical protein EOO24_35870 [Comamonadaceae bacterium]|nr:MAG: hypothetical protein EOO24_35870 [Comamonadaceae bacterium]
MRMRPVFAGLAALALSWAAPALAQMQARVERSGDAIVFDGRIHGRTADAFLQLLREDPAIRRLVITSQGGIVDAAIDMAEAIHARGLDVEVPSACFSSCANYILPAARRKLLAAPGVVAWHGNMAHVLYMQQAGQQQLGDSVIEEARRLARREAAFFRRIGVDDFICWFAKIPPYDVEDSFFLSVADMERFGLRDVTVRADRADNTDRAGLAAGAGPRLVAVDWATLDAIRPVLRLLQSTEIPRSGT